MTISPIAAKWVASTDSTDGTTLISTAIGVARGARTGVIMTRGTGDITILGIMVDGDTTVIMDGAGPIATVTMTTHGDILTTITAEAAGMEDIVLSQAHATTVRWPEADSMAAQEAPSAMAAEEQQA